MLSLSNAASIHDVRLIARRRLPRFAFDFLDGGAEDENNLRKNRAAFEQIELVPRYLVGASNPITETTILGKTYAAPFGVAPMGFFNMAWPGADIAVARLAAQQNIPCVASSVASTSLEDIAKAANGNAWFQIYLSSAPGVVDGLLERAKSAGYEILVVTVDVAQPGKRDRDIRNGFKVPFKLTPSLVADLMCHPRWSLATLKFGTPGFGNFDDSALQTTKARSLAEIQKQIISSDTVWDDLQRVRDKWHGRVVVKGILHPQDAAKAVDIGCDAIAVSNHGGRQVDYGPASLAALPSIISEVNGKVPVFVDSGIRRGADIVRAKALGADFVLAGRAFAYGAAAGSVAGTQKSFEILSSELRSTLGQLGVHDFNAADQTLLMKAGGT